MLVRKNFRAIDVFRFAGHHFSWLIPLVVGVGLLQEYTGWDWTKLPFQPIVMVGTAVAFYLGFKNNQSYDRMWEARKIWGAIVNSSRSWGSSIKSFISNLHANEEAKDYEIQKIKEKMIHRHIAWLYVLRSQLLVPTEWEHVRQRGFIGWFAKKRQKHFGVGLIDDEISEENVLNCINKKDFAKFRNYSNTATQIIDKQADGLKEIRERGLIDDFRHMELQKLLNDFYTQQGKLERIKKFPLPRQYGSMSFIFVAIFIIILPFGMLPLFHAMGPIGLVLSIPLTTIVAWVYLVMELVGDYSENPFEGNPNDIPMYSLCRTIEIDLREMLGEENIPNPIGAKRGVLM